jgi:hypothetical protein
MNIFRRSRDLLDELKTKDLSNISNRSSISEIYALREKIIKNAKTVFSSRYNEIPSFLNNHIANPKEREKLLSIIFKKDLTLIPDFIRNYKNELGPESIKYLISLFISQVDLEYIIEHVDNKYSVECISVLSNLCKLLSENPEILRSCDNFILSFDHKAAVLSERNQDLKLCYKDFQTTCHQTDLIYSDLNSIYNRCCLIYDHTRDTSSKNGLRTERFNIILSIIDKNTGLFTDIKSIANFIRSLNQKFHVTQSKIKESLINYNKWGNIFPSKEVLRDFINEYTTYNIDKDKRTSYITFDTEESLEFIIYNIVLSDSKSFPDIESVVSFIDGFSHLPHKRQNELKAKCILNSEKNKQILSDNKLIEELMLVWNNVGFNPNNPDCDDKLKDIIFALSLLYPDRTQEDELEKVKKAICLIDYFPKKSGFYFIASLSKKLNKTDIIAVFKKIIRDPKKCPNVDALLELVGCYPESLKTDLILHSMKQEYFQDLPALVPPDIFDSKISIEYFLRYYIGSVRKDSLKNIQGKIIQIVKQRPDIFKTADLIKDIVALYSDLAKTIYKKYALPETQNLILNIIKTQTNIFNTADSMTELVSKCSAVLTGKDRLDLILNIIETQTNIFNTADSITELVSKCSAVLTGKDRSDLILNIIKTQTNIFNTADSITELVSKCSAVLTAKQRSDLILNIIETQTNIFNTVDSIKELISNCYDDASDTKWQLLISIMHARGDLFYSMDAVEKLIKEECKKMHKTIKDFWQQMYYAFRIHNIIESTEQVRSLRKKLSSTPVNKDVICSQIEDIREPIMRFVRKMSLFDNLDRYNVAFWFIEQTQEYFNIHDIGDFMYRFFGNNLDEKLENTQLMRIMYENNLYLGEYINRIILEKGEGVIGISPFQICIKSFQEDSTAFTEEEKKEILSLHRYFIEHNQIQDIKEELLQKIILRSYEIYNRNINYNPKTNSTFMASMAYLTSKVNNLPKIEGTIPFPLIRSVIPFIGIKDIDIKEEGESFLQKFAKEVLVNNIRQENPNMSDQDLEKYIANNIFPEDINTYYQKLLLWLKYLQSDQESFPQEYIPPTDSEIKSILRVLINTEDKPELFLDEKGNFYKGEFARKELFSYFDAILYLRANTTDEEFKNYKTAALGIHNCVTGSAALWAKLSYEHYASKNGNGDKVLEYSIRLLDDSSGTIENKMNELWQIDTLHAGADIMKDTNPYYENMLFPNGNVCKALYESFKMDTKEKLLYFLPDDEGHLLIKKPLDVMQAIIVGRESANSSYIQEPDLETSLKPYLDLLEKMKIIEQDEYSISKVAFGYKKQYEMALMIIMFHYLDIRFADHTKDNYNILQSFINWQTGEKFHDTFAEELIKQAKYHINHDNDTTEIKLLKSSIRELIESINNIQENDKLYFNTEDLEPFKELLGSGNTDQQIEYFITEKLIPAVKKRNKNDVNYIKKTISDISRKINIYTIDKISRQLLSIDALEGEIKYPDKEDSKQITTEFLENGKVKVTEKSSDCCKVTEYNQDGSLQKITNYLEDSKQITTEFLENRKVKVTEKSSDCCKVTEYNQDGSLQKITNYLYDNIIKSVEVYCNGKLQFMTEHSGDSAKITTYLPGGMVEMQQHRGEKLEYSLFYQFYEKNNINHIIITKYNPQGKMIFQYNGPIEVDLKVDLSKNIENAMEKLHKKPGSCYYTYDSSGIKLESPTRYTASGEVKRIEYNENEIPIKKPTYTASIKSPSSFRPVVPPTGLQPMEEGRNNSH